MTIDPSDIRGAATFGDAYAILTNWLGAAGIRPGERHFAAVAESANHWRGEAGSFPSRLEGMAFLGRLWSLASWRAVPDAPNWTQEQTIFLLQDIPADWVETLAAWGSADQRRFASNALEVASTELARDLGSVLLVTESARKATKATTHHLECLRRQNLSMEALIARAPDVWSRIIRGRSETGLSALFMFENFVSALASEKWRDSEIGTPDFASLLDVLSGTAARATADVREKAAEHMLELLSNYRLATQRRKDLTPGYEPATRLLPWFVGHHFPRSLAPSVDVLLDDLERDIVGRLELGRREGTLRELHARISGENTSAIRLGRAAERHGLGEQETIWMRTGRWLDLGGGDKDIAETAAQDLDPLIAELILDFSAAAAPRDPRMADAARKLEALGRMRRMSVFGTLGQVVPFDANRHTLKDDQLAQDGQVAIVRPGVVRSRATGDSIVVKATVRNAEF